jgi:hypothetical protein
MMTQGFTVPSERDIALAVERIAVRLQPDNAENETPDQ